MPDLLHEHCALVQEADGVFERICDKTWWGHGALFGGYVQALALKAMTQTLGNAEQLPQSMTMHFIRPFLDGSFRAEANGRAGRSQHVECQRSVVLGGQARGLGAHQLRHVARVQRVPRADTARRRSDPAR